MIVNDPVTNQHGAPRPAVASRPEDASLLQRPRWFRRPSRLIPLGLLIVVLVSAAVVGYRTMAAFDTVQALSTPPPEVSGALLGGGDDMMIDTGPAQEAVRQRQQQDQGQGQTAHQSPIESGVAAREVESTAAASPVFAPGETGETGEAHSTSGYVADEARLQPTSAPHMAAPGTSPEQFDPATAPSAPVGDAGRNGGSTFLLMGVDARTGEAIDVGVRPDALAVLHLDNDGSCRMLAIPRDSRATLPGYGTSKINHALAVGGIPYEIQVVEEYLGIEIDHYGLVDFAGITQIVDSVGGIEVDNPDAFAVGDQTFAAGPIALDGERALAYARYRGGSDGDFGRIEKQQQVMRAVLDRATDVNLVTFVPSSFSLLADHIRTDVGPTTIVDLGADYLDTCTASSLETRTIPGDVATLHDDLLQAPLSFVVSDATAIRDSVDWLYGER